MMNELARTVETSLRTENLRLVNENIRLQEKCDGLQARVELLESEQGLSRASPRCLRLTRTEEKFFSVLVSFEYVSKERLHAHAYVHDPQGGADIKIVDVMICKLRKKLSRYGIEIRTVWARGYEIPPEDKKIIQTLMEAERR